MRSPGVGRLRPTTSVLLSTGLAAALVLAPSGVADAAGQAATAPAAPPTTSAATSASTPAAASVATPATAQREVSYRGVHLTVPAGWQVVDLDADPTRCVRLDVKAVYVGQPAAQQDCPAHLVGRSDTLWLHPTTAGDTRSTSSRQTRVGSLPAHTARNPEGRTKLVRFATPGVTVDAAWAGDEATVDDVLSTARATSTTGTTGTTGTTAGTTAGTGSPAVSRADARRSLAPTSATATATTSATAATTATMATTAGTGVSNGFRGMGFDTCAAPALTTMQKWYASSPYRAMGIYIGGSMRACGDGNLSASWVSQVAGMGWGLMPIYVDLQAPCVNQPGLAKIDPTKAAAQGTTAADDAVARAQAFGLGAGTPVYYDMEAYGSSDPTTAASCRQTVLTFLTAWTTELHRLGYRSGVYGSTSSVMVDLSDAYGTSGFTPPDDVWFARWNGLQTLSDSAAYPAFKDSYWASGQRIHQYQLTTETWGGVKLDIDANWVGGHVIGTPVPVDYGTRVYGPGSTSFVFTGRMDYWHSMAPKGVRSRAYYTYANGSQESNGATWSPVLPQGFYSVSASVPAATSPARATYTVTDANGSRTQTLAQPAAGGTLALGTYSAVSGRSVSVHLGDNDTSPTPSPTTATVAVDAMTFQLVATAPAAPGSVSAVPGDGQATVRWAAATDNGNPVTGYTVTASPGGAKVTTNGSARSAVVPGLTNGTAYTFTVTATNAVGTGPASTRTPAVTPLPHGHLVPVAPARLLDTRVGTTSNPVKTALAPNAALTVRVAGVTGSPVPAGAPAAAVNLTVTSPSAAGFLSVDATSSGGSSTTNFVRGQTVANLVITRLTGSGTMTIVNHSTGTVQVVADVEGYLSAAGTLRQWVSPAPTRLLDTRIGTTSNPVKTALAPNAALTVRVAGVSGSPVPAGAVAAGLNLTVTSPRAAGFLSVDATAGGGTSTTNFVKGQTVANLVITRLTGSGTMTIVNHSAGTVQVVADVEGYLAATGTSNQWVTTTPVRLVDTRTGTPSNPVKTALAANAALKVRVAGVTGSPVPAGATVAVLNLTVASPQKPGFLTADASANGGTSTANFTTGQVVANLVLTRLAADGMATIVNHSAGTVTVVVDAQGYLH
ncbi:glycoside hydrolase domain-containing protein [Intrasporangium flavum]|uniref:glycoside hydrolase domain-containing protein n=1 Tax=Intrasporangium flavum TaxID=1428657 RepID=UPI0009F9473B|nr:glycoside hydrolase domain-containing protein [Intrasporangium flavum]